MSRKTFLIAILIGVVLLTVTFIPLARQQNSSYDPWRDLNDDGVIDIHDLNLLSQVYGTSGTPIEKLGQTKTIRFYDPSEYLAQMVWTNASTFEWTPNNSTNNVLLRMCVYAEVKGYTGAAGVKTEFTVNITTGNLWRETYIGGDIEYWDDFDYRWTETFFSHTTYWIPANQPNYTLQVRIRTSSGFAYYRNINVIITVADGIPPYNP